MNKKMVEIIISIVLILAAICIGIKCWNNREVEFADGNMAKVIGATIYRKEVTTEKITYEQLKTISDLNIAYTGYYKTIKDIEKCKNIESLSMNGNVRKYKPAYWIAEGKIERELTYEEVEKLQEELTEILPKLPKLKSLDLADLGKCNWTSIDFLKGCSQLEVLKIWRSVADDYSVLKECKSLKIIVLSGCNISSADDIMGLKNMEYIALRNTPLGDKPEEIKKLQEAYPDAVIDVVNYEEEE